VHKITDADVKDAPTFDAIAAEIMAALAGCVPAAYNAAFDRAFLANEMARASNGNGNVTGSAGNAPASPASGNGNIAPGGLARHDAGGPPPPALRRSVEWLDPLVWARELQQGERSRALGEVAARLGVALENAHRAADDAEAALRVLLILGRDVRVPRTYSSLVQEQRRLSMAQADERRLNKWR
jgi:DNA polymerase-3 subunit epsilon